MASWRRQGDRRGLCRRQARHQARHRQQSPGAECDRAARGAGRIRCRHRSSHALEHVAKSACRAAGHFRLRRHDAGAQIARDRARCRRRLRLEDFHLSGRSRLSVGGAQGRTAGEVDRGSLRILSHRRAWPRPRHPRGTGARRQRQDSGAARQDHRQSRRLYVDVLVVGADLSLRHAAVGPVRHSARSIARWTRSTPTPRRSTPIAAPGARKRPSWSSGWSKWRRGRWTSILPNCASAISSSRSRTRRR